MDKNRIAGVAEQGERATIREALVIKAKRRNSAGELNRVLAIAYFDKLGVPRFS